MLTFFDRDESGSRRDFLRVGGSVALGAGGLTMAQLAALRARAEGRAAPGLLTGKSVIFLFLHGGPSQFETFDPKMTAPAGDPQRHRRDRHAHSRASPSAASFPQLAALADRLTVVRSFVPGDANHDIKPIVGRDTFGANLGSRLRPRRRREPPATRACRPTSSSSRGPSTRRPGRPRRASASSTRPARSPRPTPRSTRARRRRPPNDMRLAIPRDRLDDRRRLLGRLDRPARRLDRGRALEGVDRLREQAYRLLTGGAGRGVRPGAGRPATRRPLRHRPAGPARRRSARSGTTTSNYVDNAKSLGKLLLLARRLCERGCGFVTVTTNFVWDMHADVNNATMDEGMGYMGPPLDHAVSAFLDDLHARGLDEKILLVACGEMGRTPRINTNGGRDHWGKPRPAAAGRRRPADGPGHRPVEPRRRRAAVGAGPDQNLIATIMHTLFDVGQLRLVPDLPREFAQTMASWDPIPGLSG